MMKSSILIALFLGVIFAQNITAHSVPSDHEIANSDSTISDGEKNSNSNQPDNKNDGESPALICLLFENLGCNTECSTIASAFSIKSTGKCSNENICQCTLEQDESLEGLFRAKFDAEKALRKIKKNEDLSAKVLEILQVPFQTIDRTYREIKEVVYPAIYDNISIDDKTPAWELGLIDEADNLNYDKIKEYVSEKLKPVLESSKQLTSVNYKSNMEKSLEGKSNEDLQSIFNEVRRTKNKNLNDILDDYLNSSKIKEKKNTEKDNIADAIGYLIIDQFVNYIEESKNPDTKKQAREQSTKNVKIPKPANKKSTKLEKPKTSKKSSGAKKNTKKEAGKSSANRFDLPGFDKNFLKNYGDSMEKTFKTRDYSVYYYKNTKGSINFIWKKGVDEVEMTVNSVGSISQTWRLEDAKIKLNLGLGGSFSQIWDFGFTKYIYTKYLGENVSEQWTNGNEDPNRLAKYKGLIDEWCNKNEFLLANKAKCIIY